jgi:hypothetical protein
MGVLVRNRVGDLASNVRTTTADMKDLGLLARERILARTALGKDFKGNAFQPLSQSYLQQRSKQGLRRARTSLELSGEMLRGIQVIAEGRTVRLTF